MRVMERWKRGTVALALVAGCGPRGAVPADGPAPEPAPVAMAPHADAAGTANISFMRDMIAHHGQALDMTALVPDRAAGEDVRRLALRIEAAQRDEIARMRRWLAAQGVDPGMDHAQHSAGHRMPGMLSPQEMERLSATSGAAFDRLFIESMIRHHEGALVMVEELLSAGGGRADIQVFQLASQIDADQRAEIARMRRLLESGR